MPVFEGVGPRGAGPGPWLRRSGERLTLHSSQARLGADVPGRVWPGPPGACQGILDLNVLCRDHEST